MAKFPIRIVIIFILVLCAVHLSVIHAQTSDDLPPLIDRDIFFGDPEISGSTLSPDGKYISFIKPYNDVRNIYVKEREAPFEEAKPVTADDRPIPGYFWSQDSQYIMYVQDKDGNENFHVYAVDPSAAPEAETGVPPARDLTPYENVRAQIISVPKNTPEQMFVGLNDRDQAYHDIYRIDIATGERELIFENTQNLAGYSFDNEGNLRLAMRQLDDGGAEILRVDDGKELVRIYTTTFEESANPVRFHKDGDRFYMITNKGDVDLSQLVLFNPDSGEQEFVESDPEKRVDVGGAIFDGETDELILTGYIDDRIRLYPKTEQAKKDFDFFHANLPDGDLRPVSMTRDGRYTLVLVGRDVDPGTVYLYDREDQEIEQLYRVQPELESRSLANMKPVRYKARDGLEIPAYLTLPNGVEPKNLPAVINPHGGPWARDGWGYNPFAQFLANRGYAVLQPNFRGSTGYGKEFLNAGNNEWGTGYMQHDISDGVKYLVDEGIADPKRIGIFGGSYGGYATLAGLAFTPELYAAGVSYVGPSNLLTLLSTIPPYWAPIKKIFDKRLGNPEVPDDKQRLMEQSPLFSADRIQAPLLVLQGANDPRVKQQESDQIVVAMRDRQLPVEYIIAGDEGHGFRQLDNRLIVAAALEKFLAKHIGGRYQKDMAEEMTAKMEQMTVAINTVTLPEKTLVAYSENAPLPVGDPGRIRPLESKYSVSINMQGNNMKMDATRTISEAEFEGRKVWKITSVSQSPMGNSEETHYLDRQSLLPVAMRVNQGPMQISLDYHATGIKGSISAGQQIPIDVKLDAPVYSDGGGLETELASLPLAENYATSYRVFNLLSQKVRGMSLKVEGRETIEVAAGKYDTYKVVITPLDGEPDESVMNISVEPPYQVIRAESKLPPMMGGGTTLIELSD